jgi:flagellar motor switch protein FliM
VSTSTTADAAAHAAPVDFRRPSRIGRDAVVALEATHEAFARRLSTSWSSSSYAAIEVEHIATEQLSIDDFVRSLPVPTALATVRVPSLGSIVFVQIDLPLALLFVERLLGGPGDARTGPVGRRPTDLEAALITHELLGPAVTAIDEALRELDGEPSTLLTLETSPQPLQLGSPGELLLLLSYQVEVRGDLPARGLVTLAYPVAPIVNNLDRLLTGASSSDDDPAALAASPLADAVLGATMELAVRFGGQPLDAASIAALAPGDILSLDHRVDRPAVLVCDEQPIGTAHVGRRGRRIAAQIVRPPAGPALAGHAAGSPLSSTATDPELLA